ncbi:MAG: GyrI-like domain-containing protein [Planctomycetes bacterium]|nr:GyrI-like domain-containing protein [Planctomycetota bacterium]
MDAEITTRAETRVAYVRHVGPYQDCKPAFEQLCAWAGPRGLFGPATRIMGMAWDDPREVPAEKLRFDACMTVAESVEASEGVEVRTEPAGLYAKTVHLGPYEKLAATYESLMTDFIPAHDVAMDCERPSIEVYLSDPRTTPPEQLRTEVWFPVKKG